MLLLWSVSLALGIWTVAAGDPPRKEEEVALLPGKAATVLGLRCVSCHNPEKKAGGLDLTTRKTALSTNAIVPGKADESRVVKMTTAGKMPPDGKLPDAEITLLQRWIAAGAVYTQEPLKAIKPTVKPLWSFQPLKHPTLPHSRFDNLAHNPIDRFIFAKLEQQGLHPSPLASRLVLLRRVTIDLTGLPPTPEEIRDFLNDKSPNAYEKVVDRLLASPAYGERWGRHWLDVVRYGESHGYEQNHLRPNAWPYRDYVIRAFNQDKPYDQFLTEQLAGDIVGKGNPDIEVATGFLVAGIHDTVGIQEEIGTRQQRSNDLDDIVSTTGAAFLGLTINCAKCHDHKFDPIPTRDYYRLCAVFAGVRHGEKTLSPRILSTEQQMAVKQIQSSLQAQEDQIRLMEAAAQQKLPGNEGKHRPAVNTHRNVEDFEPVSARFVRFTILATNDGTEPCLDELQIFAPNSDINIAEAKRGGKATASSLLPGYAIHQISHLNDGILGNQHSWISNERGKGWAQIELPQSTVVSRVVWERDTDETFADRLATAYRVEISEDGQKWTEVANGNDRLLPQSNITPQMLTDVMTPQQRNVYQETKLGVDKLRREEMRVMPPTTAYCGQFTDPDPTFVLRGGDVMQRGEAVTPGTLSQITALSSDLTGPKIVTDPTDNVTLLVADKVKSDRRQTPSGDADTNPRLALAHWMCDPRNPLTARVMVNRVWEHHFGHGIVDTPSDFGNIGSPPSHPELLDYLANDFMAHGWKLKRLHRMLVTSYVYQQSNAVTAEGLAKDSDNRLLWQMPLLRMEAEAVRDAILQTSGKLNRAMGGPGYRLFQYNVVNVAIYEQLEEQGEETWRRGVYQVPARGIHDDLLRNFDCPDSSERTPLRTNTTTALQALSLLNSRFITEQAAFFAERIQQNKGISIGVSVDRAFQLAFGRLPNEREKRSASQLVREADLATLCRALLNANEFLYY
jgi:mono/diheme cytochrome c family protein